MVQSYIMGVSEMDNFYSKIEPYWKRLSSPIGLFYRFCNVYPLLNILLTLIQVLLVLLGSEKDETTTTELKSLELVSDALQALVDTNIDEV